MGALMDNLSCSILVHPEPSIETPRGRRVWDNDIQHYRLTLKQFRESIYDDAPIPLAQPATTLQQDRQDV